MLTWAQPRKYCFLQGGMGEEVCGGVLVFFFLFFCLISLFILKAEMLDGCDSHCQLCRGQQLFGLLKISHFFCRGRNLCIYCYLF